MLAQMAATAGSVAVGSTIGHGLSHMLFGGGGGNSQPVEQGPPVQQQQQQTFQQSGISCETQAKGSSPPPSIPNPDTHFFSRVYRFHKVLGICRCPDLLLVP